MRRPNSLKLPPLPLVPLRTRRHRNLPTPTQSTHRDPPLHRRPLHADLLPQRQQRRDIRRQRARPCPERREQLFLLGRVGRQPRLLDVAATEEVRDEDERVAAEELREPVRALQGLGRGPEDVVDGDGEAGRGGGAGDVLGRGGELVCLS